VGPWALGGGNYEATGNEIKSLSTKWGGGGTVDHWGTKDKSKKTLVKEKGLRETGTSEGSGLWFTGKNNG